VAQTYVIQGGGGSGSKKRLDRHHIGTRQPGQATRLALRMYGFEKNEKIAGGGEKRGGFVAGDVVVRWKWLREIANKKGPTRILGAGGRTVPKSWESVAIRKDVGREAVLELQGKGG